MGACSGFQRPSWRPLESSWGAFSLSWTLFGPSWKLLEALEIILVFSLDILDTPEAILEPSRSLSGPPCGHFGISSVHFEASWTIVWALGHDFGGNFVHFGPLYDLFGILACIFQAPS